MTGGDPSECLQVQPVGYMLTASRIGIYSMNSSKMIDNYHVVFELQPVIAQTQPGHL